MSSPLLWIFVPLFLALVSLLIHTREKLVIGLVAVASLGLAVAALLLPLDTTIKIGAISFEVKSEMVIYGRRFLLEDSDRVMLALIYFSGSFWFLGTRPAGAGRFFVPFGMGFIALLVAALAVQPFLYSALIVEIAVLFSIPMLVPPGTTVKQGVLRYLIFQTLGMPFILIAGWSAGLVDVNPGDNQMLLFAIASLGLGLALWLAIFPFYTWVPLLVGEVHPYVAGFILTLLSTVALLDTVNFLDGFSWLRSNPLVPQALRVVGILMVASGGIWAAFQQDLTRLFGYAVIIENGFALLALSLNNQVGLQAFAFAFLPRIVSLGVWALTMSIYKNHKLDLTFESLQGIIHRLPVNSLVMIFAVFSIGGLPVLSMFPVRQALLENLAKQSIDQALWVLAGSLAFLIGGFRTLVVLTQSNMAKWKIEEKGLQILLLIGGTVVLFAVGLFPAWFNPVLSNLLKAFPNLR